VVVGDQVAAGRDDHSRAEADLTLFLELATAVAEEEAEHRVVGARAARRGRLAVMLTTAGERAWLRRCSSMRRCRRRSTAVAPEALAVR
jgi:hypothetical protein